MKRINILTSLAAVLLGMLSMDATAQTAIYSQDFSGTYPWGMTTNSLNASPYVWESGNSLGGGTEPLGSTGDYATADSDNTCSDEWDAELVTPSIDLSSYENVELSFDSYFEGFLSFSTMYVDISTDNGVSWTTIHSESSYEDQNTVLPLTAYEGMADVKIRFRYEDPFGCSYWWSIDNILVEGDLLAPCSGTPTAGAAVSNAPQVCSQAILSLSGNVTAFGLTYVWQSSTDGIVWTDIPGVTSSSTTQTLSGTTSFRAIVTCAGLSDTSTAVTVGLSSFLDCYCIPTYTYDCSIDYTANVKFGSIDNSSTCSGSTPENYSDYTSLNATVIKGVSYPLSVTTDGDEEGAAVWIDFDHSGTFDASELVLNGFAGTVPATYTANVLIPATALDGPTVMRVRNRYNGTITAGQACASFTYGETEDYSVTILAPPADEAGVVTITQPATSACTLGNELWVELQNLGSNPLTEATFDVSVNGIVLPSASWTGNVAPSSTQEVQVPVSYAFSDGDSISVTVSNPNGQVEDVNFAFNNQYGRRVFAALSGVKTVYGGTADYADLDAAITDLQLRGICDTVYFKVASGTYATQHIFGSYLDAGPGKLAVFESASGNAADVTYSVSGTAGDNYVFSFDGASYYALRNITAINSNTTYAGVIDFRGDVDYVELGGNVFQGDTAATYQNTNYNKTIAVTDYNSGNDYDNIWIHDNSFLGGIRSLDFELVDDKFSDLVIENNSFEGYSLLGVLTYTTNGIKVSGNTFKGRSGITGNQSGMQIINSFLGGNISGNDIYLDRAGFGVLLSDIPGASNPLLVSNNFIYTGDTTVSATSYGIYVEEYGAMTGNVVIANNSISFRSKNPANAGINLDSGNEIAIVNNNIGSFNTSPAISVSDASQLSQMANNNIYGTTLAQIGGSSYTLASLQSAGFGSGSFSVNPGFNGTDLHTCTPELNGSALALSSVTVDIDGDLRSATPDIGADEFMGDAGALLVEDYFLKCPDDEVALGNSAVSGVTYSWSPAGSSSEILVTAEGTYVISATSSCGTYSDTVVVENKELPVASFTSSSVGLTGIFSNTSTAGTTYAWDFGDGSSSSEFSPSHVYALAGTYSVSLTVTNECGSSTFGPNPVNVINASISESEELSWNIFPNPADDKVTISVSKAFDGLTNAQVIDIHGKVVKQVVVAPNLNQLTIDIAELASGLYSIRFVGQNEFSVRFVKK